MPPGSDEDIHAIDNAKLGAYLRAQGGGVFGGSVTAERLKGGASNPTYLLECASGGHGRRFILRKKPPGPLLPSAHQIEREYRIMAALAATDVPVPTMRLLCEDVEVIGTPFYIMDFLEGRIFRDTKLPGMPPDERRHIYHSFVHTMARLHRIDIAAVGLGDYGRPGNYFDRQLARWIRQYRAAATEPIPAMERLIAELPALIPAAEPPTIAHGDFRIENLMFHPTEPRVIALLDWELSTLGSPLADLGYACIGYYAALPWFGTLDGVDFATSGIPDQAGFVADYCAQTSRDGIPDLAFYVAFALFRLAAIAQGVFRRGQDGVGTGHASGSHNDAPSIAGFGAAMLNKGQ